MLNGIKVSVTAKDRAKLEAVVADRNSPGDLILPLATVWDQQSAFCTPAIVDRIVG